MYKLMTIISKIIFTLFFRVSVEGCINLPENQNYIICCNHIHMIDPGILMISTKKPIRFVVKNELMHTPIVKNIMKGCNVIPVRRGEVDISAIKSMIKALKNNEVLGLFPEGTRHKDGEFKDIKEGAALIACKTNVPIIPTRICGKYKLFSKIKYKIGEPIYTEGKTKEEVTKELFNSIENLK